MQAVAPLERVMKRFVIRQNIEHYRALLDVNTDPSQRRSIEQLLHDEEAKLKKYDDDNKKESPAWRCWRRCAAPHHASAACPWHGGRASTDFHSGVSRSHGRITFSLRAMLQRSTLTRMIDCLLVSIRKKLAACALLPVV
jgi:hypothetical protein